MDRKKAAALILAPAAVPFVYSVLFTLSYPGTSLFWSFWFFFTFGAFLSYVATIILLMPCLYLIARYTPLTARLTGLVGAALGGAVWFPVMWQSYCASGDNSGPPFISFWTYLRRDLFSVDMWLFPAAGLATALLYWFLSTRSFPKLRFWPKI